MRIEITFPTHGDPLLPAAFSLSGLPSSALYFKEHGFRHPLGAYNTSSASVLRSFLDVLATAELFGPEPTSDQLARVYDPFLDTLQEHHEDCSKILHVFFPKDERVANSPVAKDFKAATKTYDRHIGAVVNRIKHHQGRLRPISFYGPQFRVNGYFVEAVLADGAIGPWEQIHPDSNSAISLNYDLRRHFFSLLAISTHLADAVSALVGPSSPRNDDSAKPSSTPNLLTVAERIAALPDWILTNESALPWYHVSVSQPRGRAQRRLIAHLGSPHARPRVITQPYSIDTWCSGDGVSRSFKIPYFGKRST
jgi:hypothetical protein